VVPSGDGREQADPRQLSAFDHMPLPAVIDLLLATTTLTTTGDAKRGWRGLRHRGHAARVVRRQARRTALLGGPGMLAGIGAEVFAALGRATNRRARGSRGWPTIRPSPPATRSPTSSGATAMCSTPPTDRWSS
jgi:hypothetical protein